MESWLVLLLGPRPLSSTSWSRRWDTALLLVGPSVTQAQRPPPFIHLFIPSSKSWRDVVIPGFVLFSCRDHVLLWEVRRGGGRVCSQRHRGGGQWRGRSGERGRREAESEDEAGDPRGGRQLGALQPAEWEPFGFFAPSHTHTRWRSHLLKSYSRVCFDSPPTQSRHCPRRMDLLSRMLLSL